MGALQGEGCEDSRALIAFFVVFVSLTAFFCVTFCHFASFSWSFQ